MTTMLSLILAFMLSLGGSPAASVNPAGCPGDTGIQAPIDNNRTINHFSEDYNQKTASRANSKKTGKTPSIKELKTSSSIMFARFSIEKLRQASYFDHKSYRFNSVDPVITKDEALSNPQFWNLYAYCRNNPISFIDPTGALEHFTFILNNQDTSNLEGSGMSIPAFSGYGEHTNNPSSINVVNLGPIPTGKYYIVDRPKGLKEKILGAGRKENWFALFRADDKVDDQTDVYVDTNKFVKRKELRLHYGAASLGCLTVTDEKGYEKLREKLLSTKTGKIPGTIIKHYGTIEVKSPQIYLKEK
jgi:hypothetical protein